MDHLSKRAHFVTMSNLMLVVFVAHTFSKHVVKHHRILRTLVSDRDRIFMSSFWRDLFCLQGTTLKHSSTYYLQTEVVNQCLKEYLHCFIMTKPSNWSKYLHLVEYWYNSFKHSSIGMLSFEATFGCPSPPLFQDINSPFSNTVAGPFKENRCKIMEQLKTNLAKALCLRKKQVDLKRSDVEF